MARHVRFLRDWDFWVSSSVVVAHKAGEEKRLPQVQADAAIKAKAVEFTDADRGEDERPKRAAPKDGAAA